MTEHIKDRLLNFGRYWQDTQGTFGRCRSIEGRYIPGADERALFEAEAQQERKSRPSPDRRDAEVVHEAWRRCSPRAKRLLKWCYCMGRRSDEDICRRCKIRFDPPTVLALAHYNAVKEIERILDEPVKSSGMIARRSPRTSSDKSLPASAATNEAPRAARSSLKIVEEVD